MKHYGLNPVDTFEEMRTRLELQPEEEGTLLAYLDKMHYPLWITQFYENISQATEAIVDNAAAAGVATLELRYSPIIHTFAGLTPRQSIRAVLSGMNHASKRHPMKLGLVVIAMRQHGPHIAKILARQAISEAQHLHARLGVVGFDIAGPERGNPPGTSPAPSTNTPPSTSYASPWVRARTRPPITCGTRWTAWGPSASAMAARRWPTWS